MNSSKVHVSQPPFHLLLRLFPHMSSYLRAGEGAGRPEAGNVNKGGEEGGDRHKNKHGRQRRSR